MPRAPPRTAAPAGTSRPRPPGRQTAASLHRSRALQSDALCGRCDFSWLAPLGRNSLVTVVRPHWHPSARAACRYVAASGCWARGGPGAHGPRCAPWAPWGAPVMGGPEGTGCRHRFLSLKRQATAQPAPLRRTAVSGGSSGVCAQTEP